MPKADYVARLCKVLSVENRVRILQLLKGRALCVGALAARLNVTQGAVSQHLRVMRDAGLVVDDKHGTYVHYRINERTLATWREAMTGLLDPTAGSCPHTKGAGPCAAATRRKAVRGRKT